MNNDLLKISLNQGKQFKNNQNKIKHKNVNRSVSSSKKEGFVSGEQEMMLRPTDDGFRLVVNKQAQTSKYVTNTNQLELDKLNTLLGQYNSLFQQYSSAQKTISDSSLATLGRLGSNNPYSNKNVRFSDGTLCYVTNEGIVRPYTNLDIFKNTAGKNGCPKLDEIMNIDFSFAQYNFPGATVPTSPPLIVGDYMVEGNSCGMEGKNVYTSSLVKNPMATYIGCYSDKPADVSSVDDSQRAMIWNPNTIGYTTYNICQDYALNNGYQYFGLQDYKPDGTAQCLVSNDIDRTKSYGDGSIQIDTMIAIWSSNTNIGGSRMSLSAESGINVLNGNDIIYSSNFNGIVFYSDCGFAGQKANASLGQHNVAEIGFPNDSLSSLIVPNSFGIVLFKDDIGTEPSLSLGAGQYPCLVDNGWNDLVSNYTAYFTGNCYLLLQDDGNVVISKGNPGVDYDVVWATGTNNKQLGPNPLWIAEKGKYGRNYIQLGEGLNSGEWIGSNNGSMRLIMQTDGNLVLYTSTIRDGCINGNNGQMYGGPWVNAVYKLNNMGDKSSLGKVGYITGDSKLQPYPDSMLGLSNDYEVLQGINSPSNDIASWSGLSQTDCQNKCNEDANCYGYAYKSVDQICWTKNSNTYPKGSIQPDPSMVLGVRKPSLKNPPTCSNEIANIDTIQYANYNKGDSMTPDTQCNVSVVPQQDAANLENIENQLSALGTQIAATMEDLYNKDKQIYKKLNMNETQFKKDLINYRNVRKNIKNLLEIQYNNNIEGMTNMGQDLNINDINGMLTDADLNVLQGNYDYIFWSVLAIGIVTITINMMKK